jgi:hypothetical protein
MTVLVMTSLSWPGYRGGGLCGEEAAAKRRAAGSSLNRWAGYRGGGLGGEEAAAGGAGGEAT